MMMMMYVFPDTDEQFPSYELLVGVLSARHHHDLRQVIRDTWMGYLKDHPEFQHRSVAASSLPLPSPLGLYP